MTKLTPSPKIEARPNSAAADSAKTRPGNPQPQTARPPLDPRVRIGHVHLKVADLDRAIAFYRDVLGFQVTQTIRAECGVSVRRRLSPSHRTEHVGKRGRFAAAAGCHRPLPCGFFVSHARGAGRRPCAACSTRTFRSKAPPTTASVRPFISAIPMAMAWSFTGTGRKEQWPRSRGWPTGNVHQTAGFGVAAYGRPKQ